MKDFFKKTWRVGRWPLGILLLLYVALVLFRIPAVGEAERTQAAVARIHAAKLTIDTVLGEQLPPPPTDEAKDATVAGVDNNQNGIRDDVERAIFAKYPNSMKIRAAELQYAMALQLMITEVFNTDTWKAAAQEVSRGYECVGNTVVSNDLNEAGKLLDSRINEIDRLVFDTQARINAKDRAYDFTTSYGDSKDKKACDIDLNTLPN